MPEFRSTIIDELTERGLVPQVLPNGSVSPCGNCVFDCRGDYQGIECWEVPCDDVIWLRKEDAQ